MASTQRKWKLLNVYSASVLQEENALEIHLRVMQINGLQQNHTAKIQIVGTGHGIHRKASA